MTIGIVGPSSLVKRPIKKLGTIGETSVLMSQLHKWWEKSGPQLDLEPMK